MIITANYLGSLVSLEVPDGNLVYDGENFVASSIATEVQLIATYIAVSQAGLPKPEDVVVQATTQKTYSNRSVCAVVSRNAGYTAPTDIVAVTDPLGGAQVFGITTDGINVHNIEVYPA